MFFWKSLAFLMIQRMLAIWSLVPVPFLNPAWTSGTVNTVHSSWWLAIEPSQPLLPLLLLPSIFSKIRVFSNESALHIRWANYWSFSFSISPSSENSGLISFRTDKFDLLAVQGTLRVFSRTTIQKWNRLIHTLLGGEKQKQTKNQKL